MSRYIKIEPKDKSKFPELLQENDLILDKSTFLVYRWFMSEELFREMYGDYKEIPTTDVKPIVIEELEKIKAEIGKIILFEEARNESAILAYECLGIVDKELYELKGENK